MTELEAALECAAHWEAEARRLASRCFLAERPSAEQIANVWLDHEKRYHMRGYDVQSQTRLAEVIRAARLDGVRSVEGVSVRERRD